MFVYCFKDVTVRIIAEDGKKALIPVDFKFIKTTFEYVIEENPNRIELVPFPLKLMDDFLDKSKLDDIHIMKCGDDEEEVSDLESSDSSDEASNLESQTRTPNIPISGPLKGRNLDDKYIFKDTEKN
jgi:hypothetical protein